MDINPNDVNGNSSPIASEGVIPQPQLPEAPVVTSTVPATQVPGSQTPSENLLAALKEERAKRKELEDKLNQLTTTTPSEEVYSDEGKVLSDKIASLEDRLVIRDLQEQFPQLKELSAEFDEFRKDYPRHKPENVAKLFLTEKGLLESQRKGLENPTGGPRTPQTSEMTPQEIEHLRRTNYKLYKEKLMKGLIKV